MALPTLADLKTHLNIPDTETTDDTELTSMLNAAINVVENIVGPMSGAPVTETHYAVYGPTVVTRRYPVSSLTDVSLRSCPGSTWVDQTITDFDLNPDTGEIRQTDGYLIAGDVQITYTAGFADVPAAVSLATLIVAANLWETQRGAMPLPANSTDDDMSANTHFAPAIPNRAKTLLEPYALGPMVA